MIDISIVIVNWNTCKLLLNCLESVYTTKGELTLEVLVVDNASTDDSVVSVALNFPDVSLIVNSDNKGFASANNQAILQSSGKYTLLLNSDTIVHPDALTQLVAFLDKNPNVGIVGPRLLNGDGSLQESWAAFPNLWAEFLGKNIRTRRPFSGQNSELAYQVDWTGGACLLIRRQVIEQIGPMDERFFMYSEETDWCYRAHLAGWETCYLPNAIVTHLGGQSSKNASEKMRIQLYHSKMLFYHKHYGKMRTYMLGQLLLLKLWFKAVFLSQHPPHTVDRNLRQSVRDYLKSI